MKDDSELTEEPMELEESSESSQRQSGQPISPPLSPVEIKKILFPGFQAGDRRQSEEGHAQTGHYHPVTFERKLGAWIKSMGPLGNSGSRLEVQQNPLPTI